MQPLLSITPRAFNPQRIQEFSDVIFTSKHAVIPCATYLNQNQRLWCVGEKTAKTCHDFGFHNIITGPGRGLGLRDEILELLKKENFSEEKPRFLHLSGENIMVDFEKGLFSHGISCDRIVVYQTNPMNTLRSTTLRVLLNETVTHITLFSLKSAQTLLALLNKYSIILPLKTELFVMSEAIASVFPKHIYHLIRDEDDILTFKF